MFRKLLLAIPLLVLLNFGVMRPAAAQFAVIDVASLVQLIQEYETLQDELSTTRDALSTARDHLTQAREEYASLTGQRGMQSLLSGQVRNYLPTDWSAVSAALQGGGGSFGTSVQSIIGQNAVLTPQAIARLSPAELAHLNAARENAALLQALSRQALSTSSGRFTSLQQLIDAIPSTSDPKGALELQARVTSEQTMLQNDNTKLQALYAAAQAEERALSQRRDEQAVADIGSLRTLAPMGLR